jgi:hypothetical protein
MSSFELGTNVTFNDNCKTENGELRIRGTKRKITVVMFISLNNVTTYGENVHHFVLKHKRALRLTPQIAFCNII